MEVINRFIYLSATRCRHPWLQLLGEGLQHACKRSLQFSATGHLGPSLLRTSPLHPSLTRRASSAVVHGPAAAKACVTWKHASSMLVGLHCSMANIRTPAFGMQPWLGFGGNKLGPHAALMQRSYWVSLHQQLWSSPASLHAHHFKWRVYQQYLTTVNRHLYETISPYWALIPWSSFQALYRQTCSWLPSLPGFRLFYVPIFNSLNTVGSALPRTVFLTAAELARNSSNADGQNFHYAVEVPVELVHYQSWWHATLSSIKTTVVRLARVLWLLLLFAPVILSSPLALKWNIYRSEWMELLRRTLEAAGPAFIKWGQWAATRHDLFPPDMCSELERMQVAAPSHQFKHTKKAIEEAFGMKLSDIFLLIDIKPVASGSIGQIHRAVLSPKGASITGCQPGQLVAIKVRHPGVAETILRDFETMLWVAHLASDLPALQHLRLEDTLKQFAAPLKEQVDLAREADNLQRFNYNFRKTHNVQFPVPLYPLVSTDVLVETFEEGDHITSYINSKNNPYNHRLSVLGSGTMLQMMLVDNLIHSDLHPGNILVRLNPPRGFIGLLFKALDTVKNSSHVSNVTRARLDNMQQRWLQPQLVLLDVGMATELSDEDQTNMIGLFRSFAAMDGHSCADWVLRFSGPAQTCPDPKKFKLDMEHTFQLVKAESTFSSGADALANVLELVRLHQVSLPGHICAVVVTTMVLEGWSHLLDPDHSVLSQVQKMFEGVNVAWKDRIVNEVDQVMEDEGNHFILT